MTIVWKQEQEFGYAKNVLKNLSKTIIMKTKFCQEGNHEVPNLFWRGTKERKSACAQCARKYAKPISKTVKVISSNKPLNKTLQSTKKNKSKDSIPELLKLATIVFNRFIRNRDCNHNYGKCISCNRVKHFDDLQCGHYMPTTYSHLRFNEYNCHIECVQCNCFDERHLIGYRQNLMVKIGIDKVLWLEEAPLAQVHKWTKEELYEIINQYK